MRLDITPWFTQLRTVSQSTPYARWGLGMLGLLIMGMLGWLLSSPTRTPTPPTPETHATVLTTTTVSDHASRDQAEETLETVAVEYNHVLADVHALQVKQHTDHASLMQSLHALQAEMATLRTTQPVHPPHPKPMMPVSRPHPLTLHHTPHAKRLGWVHDCSHDRPHTQPPVATPSATPPPDVIPYYTLPANATSVQATLMTALVGRLPVNGHVQDPYPFKIMLGPENLAANGHQLPDIAGLIVAGVAVGDLTLRSVKGWVTSLTFVFPDGRIHTVQAETDHAALPTPSTRLGYLSDPYGNPCIPGTLITNAPRALTTQALLGSLDGLTGAVAHTGEARLNISQTRTASADSAHLARWLFGKTAQEATHQVTHWWHQHASGSFDAIYVPAGRPVVIHFTREIAIDYHTHGRKLRYAHPYPLAASPLDAHTLD